jgi:hypothetical protein
MPEHRRTWGFRLSVIDMVFLLVAIVATWLVLPHSDFFAWVIPVAVGHFFLFCNVIRIIRWKEFLWSIVFVVDVAVWGLLAEIQPLTAGQAWSGILTIQLPLTLLLIITELFTPRYHGILARRFNTHLDDYLAGKDVP